VLRGALDGTAVVIHYPHTFRGENGNVAIRQEKHFARVLEQCGDVASDEIFSFSETNHGRRAKARRNNLLRIICREKDQRVDAAQFLQ